jgi:large subunit ribosomal protein L6
MKQKISEKIEIPQGIVCSYVDGIFYCKKGSQELSRKIQIPEIEIKVEGNTIHFECKKGNKNQYKTIKSYIAHIKNFFRGLDEKFVYELESCNVHFPMTLKVQGNQLIINNFLGEKKPRHAEILKNVDVDIKGQKITISSADREAAGQTAANFERATKIRAKDRRIFQDGIFITAKPRRDI